MSGDFYQILERVQFVGEDKTWSDIWIERCTLCGTYWLEFAHEEPAFTASGLWYLLPIVEAEIAEITADNARALFEFADWYFRGGSYYGGEVRKQSGRFEIAPWIGIN